MITNSSQYNCWLNSSNIMPKQTAFPISSTQRASLDDSIKELVKRRNDQREELIKEFELKYDLVYNNCRRKN